ncbi:ATP synthase F1 subunit gamma [Rubrivirga litoralis]|uniref:ATP synthase gamma chain n=1 Tax=Rubrivirga litoralis TaxID=3075598 RepID=A0ABU3BM85_9BACT|nr:ATP synthase F1 subunit gamma [Rubrivirga sp. F394]MDT0630391.1 ATP synthase F1 subunit gamma [Rubrivirga sp. F394]
MASLRDIRTRIGSVKNTQQITRAMKMVAAAKLRRAQERIFSTRPYAFKIREMIGHLRQRLDVTSHPLFEARDEVEGALLIVVTSDRGLAGAFNTNILKVAEATIAERFAAQRDAGRLRIVAVGRKAHEYFGKRGFTLVGDFQGLFNDLRFPRAGEITDLAVEGYLAGEWDVVEVVYNEFKNTITQNRIAEQLLPIPAEAFFTPVMEEAADLDTAAGEADEVEYIFEPSAEVLLERLIPEYLQYQLWRALLESNASEQGARMVAMDNATTNAGELLKDLKLTYNRARQAAITTEIIEISSGAEAMTAG